MTLKKSLDAIKKFMLQKRETLAVAESVTSGTIQMALSHAEDATQFFQGGLTAYNAGQKARLLRIDPIYCMSCNCVSERIAIEMAQHVCESFCCDWGIGITGYAAPIPEMNIRQPYAFFAIVRRNRPAIVRKIIGKKVSIEKNQKYYTSIILKDFESFLKKNTHKKREAS